VAAYVREAGEVELLKEVVEGGRDGKRLPGRLIVTNRRLVMLLERKSSGLAMMLAPWIGALGMAAMGQLGSLELTHEIEREDFAAVELEGRKMMSFHSKGEGYAHISFVVYSRTPFEVWQQRMHQWLAGTLGAAPIPPARVVDR
jgi:hypothetical protein